ncbi:hypothetical protein [Phenylobacterium sp.]|uniref:hypothetical protein n=1 Tax=Phenylobacterium sp. TaxID=1871053 RepID=UPI0028117686|nr:hypothetical protein [Phenylobacterium sp.]
MKQRKYSLGAMLACALSLSAADASAAPKAPNLLRFAVPLSFEASEVGPPVTVGMRDTVARVFLKPRQVARLQNPAGLKLGKGAEMLVFAAVSSDGRKAWCGPPEPRLFSLQGCVVDLDGDGRFEATYHLTQSVGGASYFGGPAVKGPSVPADAAVTLLTADRTAFPATDLFVAIDKGKGGELYLALGPVKRATADQHLERRRCEPIEGDRFRCVSAFGAEVEVETTDTPGQVRARLVKPFDPSAPISLGRDVWIRY